MRYPVYEIIIVDNAPLNDDTKTLVAELPVRYIREKRLGLNWARNRGIQEARYPIVAFTDDDAKVDEHWLYAINNAFRDENVKAVSGMVGPAELNTKAQRMFELGYGGMGHGFDKKYFNRVLISNGRQLWASSFGIGANMAFRKEVFDKIGQFDVAFDVGTPSRGGGDVEMFFRLVNSGYTMLYDPAMLIWHMHRKSMEALWRQVEDNGKSTGCFLIHVFRQKKVRRLSVLRFLVVEWLWKWNIHNLLKKKKHFSRKISLCELRGLIGSPYAYWLSQKKARQVRLASLD
jgi:cellulose synthase/poly-beta-1,6-N-acetylglucosamine synthase-like glycosyltransferase